MRWYNLVSPTPDPHYELLEFGLVSSSQDGTKCKHGLYPWSTRLEVRNPDSLCQFKQGFKPSAPCYQHIQESKPSMEAKHRHLPFVVLLVHESGLLQQILFNISTGRRNKSVIHWPNIQLKWTQLYWGFSVLVHKKVSALFHLVI